MNLLQACADPKLFAPWFRDRATWVAWFAFIAALFGHQMTEEQLAIYRECTGREEPPADPAREAWLVVGRRGGKSFVLALLAVFLGTFRDYRPYLAPGERATVMVIARDRKQARVILRYVRAMLFGIPLLERMVERDTAEGFDLDKQVTIEVATASSGAVRAYTIAAALLDELAFWPNEDSADPDVEIINAIRPAMATIPSAVLLCGSSPYARRGALWEAYRQHFGKADDPVLVWQAPTRRMNPRVPQAFVDAEMQRDAASAAAEYGAQFRTDVEALLTREAIDAVVSPGVFERGRVSGVQYFAFVDPSGGSADSMTMAIGHRETDRTVLDALRERKPPFSPEAVVDEFATVLLSYGVSKVRGDQYAGEWPREQFRKKGISYEVGALPKSSLYRDLLPVINSGAIDLLDNDRLRNQLIGLERRTARGGRDSIDHAPGGHDDVANVVAGVASFRRTAFNFDNVTGPADDHAGAAGAVA